MNLLREAADEFEALNRQILEVRISILIPRFNYRDRRYYLLPQHLRNNRQTVC
jgi:hypothetical protein